MRASDSIEARVSEVLEALRTAAGEAWVCPVRVKAYMQAKLRPRACGKAACGYVLDEGPIGLSMVVYFPTGVVLEVSEDQARTLIRTRG